MTAGVSIVKTNGTGNDFILIDERDGALDDPVAFARRVCDRTQGVGADGVLLVGSSERYDARMRIINADGSEAEMCGNGMRCVARYLAEHDGRETAVVETLAGPIRTRIVDRNPFEVAVEMAEPRIATPLRVPWRDRDVRAVPVDLGNPHAVIIVADLAQVEIAIDGPLIEHDTRFPHGTNVHFVAPAGTDDARHFEVVHWERGAGATRACGTGAVAVAAVLIDAGLAVSPVDLQVPGGVLRVAWTPGGPATLFGDAVLEFERVVG